jgi:hypothetical protein
MSVLEKIDKKVLVGAICVLVLLALYLFYRYNQNKALGLLYEDQIKSLSSGTPLTKDQIASLSPDALIASEHLSKLSTWKKEHPISQVVYDTCMSKHKEADAINDMKFSDPNIKKQVDGINTLLFSMLLQNKENLCKQKKTIKELIVMVSDGISREYTNGEICSRPMSEFEAEMKADIMQKKARQLQWEISRELAQSEDRENYPEDYDVNGDMKFTGGDVDMKASYKSRMEFEKKINSLNMNSIEHSMSDKLQLAIGMLSFSVAKKFCTDGKYHPELLVAYLNKLLDEFCSSTKLEYVLKQNYNYIMGHLTSL